MTEGKAAGKGLRLPLFEGLLPIRGSQVPAEIVAVDPDHEAITILRRRIESEGLENRVRTMCCSIFKTDFDAASFDIVWEEGVFHLLDADHVLNESARLLKLEGFLAMFETNEWLERNEERILEHAFERFGRIALPPGSWWTRARRRTRSRPTCTTGA